MYVHIVWKLDIRESDDSIITDGELAEPREIVMSTLRELS